MQTVSKLGPGDNNEYELSICATTEGCSDQTAACHVTEKGLSGESTMSIGLSAGEPEYNQGFLSLEYGSNTNCEKEPGE
jgi:hypothetical protein